jgi:hypothetical protein
MLCVISWASAIPTQAFPYNQVMEAADLVEDLTQTLGGAEPSEAVYQG